MKSWEQKEFPQDKSTYEKLIVYIIFSDERLKAFSHGSGIRYRCSFLLLLFNIILEVLARAVEQEKEMKGI